MFRSREAGPAPWLLVLALAASAAGIWLRAAALDRDSVYHDEAHSALMARLPADEIIPATAATDNNPPLYYLVLHAYVRAAGDDSETPLRMPSAIFGIAGLAATFLAARQIGGTVVGLWAAGLLALSVFHVQFSREARMYTLLYAAATASFYLFLKLRTGGWAAAVLWIACTLATLLAHTLGVLVLVAQHLAWAVLRVAGSSAPTGSPETALRPPLRRWLVANAAVAILAAPWTVVAVDQYRRLGGVFWVPPSYLTQPLDVLATIAGSLPVLAALLALACLGAFAQTRRWPALRSVPGGRAVVPILVIWGAVPLLAPWLASFVAVPILTPRVAIATLAPLVIAAAFGLAALPPRAALVAGGLLLAVSGRMAWQYTEALTKEDWRSVAALVQPQLRPGDLLLFHEGSRRKGFDYYVPQLAADVAGFPARRFNNGQTVERRELDDLRRLVDGHRRVWLVLASSNDPNHLIEGALSARLALTERREFRRVTVMRYDAR